MSRSSRRSRQQLLGFLLLSLGFAASTSAFQPSNFGQSITRMRRRNAGDGMSHASSDNARLMSAKDTNIDPLSATAPTSAYYNNEIPPSKKSQYHEDFCNKNILITGASGGLGRCLAHQLAKCSPSSLILSGRNTDKLDQVAQECREIAAQNAAPYAFFLHVFVVPCDLTDTASVDFLGERALELCSELSGGSGVVDVLINNGGISSRSDFVDTTIDVDEQLMQVNFLSGARLAKMVVPPMIQGGQGSSGGCIIWISSVQGLLGIPSRTSYAASKFAVQGYCEALRAELASSNISVHVVSPGYIRTDLSKSAITGDGKLHGKMDATTANGADPDEVALAVLEGVSKRRKRKGGGSDFVVAAGLSAKIAIWLRLLAPGFLEKKLQKRHEKSQGQK